jgi:small subunit ribosomal protein S13
MARLAGVNIPEKKQVWVGLTSIYGVGRTRALEVCQETGIKPETKVSALTEDELNTLRNKLQEYVLEGDLRNQVLVNIKRLIDIGSYRGLRHRRGMPVRGQRTRTNARTRKGKRSGPIASKRKE